MPLDWSGFIPSPAYDLNPNEAGTSLHLNISMDDNSLEFDLAMEVAEYFRLSNEKAKILIPQIKSAVKNWRTVAKSYGISKDEQEMMSPAFSKAYE